MKSCDCHCKPLCCCECTATNVVISLHDNNPQTDRSCTRIKDVHAYTTVTKTCKFVGPLAFVLGAHEHTLHFRHAIAL